MKNQFLLSLSLIVLSLAPSFGQVPPPPPFPTPQRSPLAPGQGQAATHTLTQFSLDFPGGMPRQLIAAIEKAMGKPVNAIIPAEHADVKLPPLKMNNVNVSELFNALLMASLKREAYSTGNMGSYQIASHAWGFKTDGNPAADDAIWYFYVEKPVLPPPSSPLKVCRFYPLTAYLDRGLTVDDITTAVQTGWKMLGDKEPPTISFHKETKLLIAVGEPAKLETIDAVLKALTPTSGDPFTDKVNSIIQKAGAGASPVPQPLRSRPLKVPETSPTEN